MKKEISSKRKKSIKNGERRNVLTDGCLLCFETFIGIEIKAQIRNPKYLSSIYICKQRREV